MKIVSKKRLGVASLAVAAGVVTALVSGQFAGADPHAPTSPPPGGARIHAAGAAGNRPAAANYPSSPANSTFVPITPCRIADTRSGGGGIGRNSTRSFQVTGSSSLASQGGTSTGCGIPASANAVAVSITATGETGNSYVTVYPTGASRPTATAVSFRKGENISGNADVPLGSGKITAYIGSGGATQLIVDVAGYYQRNMAALIYTGGGSEGDYSGTPRIVSVTNSATGSAVVTFDQDVYACTVTATPYYSDEYAAAGAFQTNHAQVAVSLWKLSSGSEVPTDDYVYVKVDC